MLVRLNSWVSRPVSDGWFSANHHFTHRHLLVFTITKKIINKYFSFFKLYDFKVYFSGSVYTCIVLEYMSLKISHYIYSISNKDSYSVILGMILFIRILQYRLTIFCIVKKTNNVFDCKITDTHNKECTLTLNLFLCWKLLTF